MAFRQGNFPKSLLRKTFCGTFRQKAYHAYRRDCDQITVGVSRFKTRAGCYLYGKLRRSDFLPVGEELDEEVLEHGYDSVSSEESDGAGLEYAFEDQSDDGSEVSVGGAANRLDSVDFAV